MPLADIGVVADGGAVIIRTPAIVGIGNIIVVVIELDQKAGVKQIFAHGVADEHQTQR